MYLMYVDESGDCGMVGSPSRYFVLTGLVVHELRWQSSLEQMLEFRRRMRAQYGLHVRSEIHSAALLQRPGRLAKIQKHDRLAIIRSFAAELASMPGLNIVNVVVDKQEKSTDYDVFANAWRALVQRFENTAAARNFQGPQNADDRGMLFPDRTDDKKLVQLLRRMRKYNPVPSLGGGAYRNLAIRQVIEDPNFRDSSHSHFIQAADCCAFLLYQHLAPCGYMRRKSGHNYFFRLTPILCTRASKKDAHGIVRL